MFAELRSALTAARRAPGLEQRDELRVALTAARELVRTAQLRTRADWLVRGFLQPGVLYLEERDRENLNAAEELLRRRS